ncbi:MAG: 2-hydroxychromene-2-carboxylate isomerase [Pseudomonadota bacterium]
MSAVIDYYYFGASPFTYFGHDAIQEVAQKHGASLNVKPVNLMGVWAESGAQPPAQRPPVRQRYRFLELQRIAEQRGKAINYKPAFFPADMTLADSATIAILLGGGDPLPYMGRVFAGVWEDEANLADRDEVAKRLTETGHDADEIIARAESGEVAAVREQNTRDATAADAVGVPAYVLNGEVFWGQDRIEFIDAALASGREPFRAL